MKKKTCIITGANSGIGRAAAIQIARKGYHVIIGARNEERGKKAIEDIKAASHSEDIELLLIDLASRDSIVEAAKIVNTKFDCIDVLIHNAAEFDYTKKMAETYTLLATSPEYSAVSGKYFDEKNKIVSSSKYSQDKQNIKELIDLSMKYINDSQ